MRYLSAVILIFLLAVAPSCKYIKNKGLFGKKDRTLERLRAEQDSMRIADSIRKVRESLLVIKNAKLDSIRLNKEAQQVAINTSKYNIIVGSFLTPEYAISHAETYRQQGYDAKIFKKEGSNFELVSAESHQRLGKAISRLHQFQDTVEIDAWIYIRK